MISTTQHNLSLALLSTVALSISALPLQGTTLISYSGSSSSPVAFDDSDLSLLSGTIASGSNAGQDLAFDESGRLFGINFDRIYEYDPVSLSVLGSASVSGDINGLAARNGILYAYSGFSAAPVTFDANDFSLLSGTIASGSNAGQDFAFDESGRLFGINSDRIYEYDPVSLSVLGSASVSGDINGLAARNGSLYTYSGFSTVPVIFDANDFSLLSGTIASGSNAGQDIAFDGAGRLFGINFDRIYEYDPASLSVLASASVSGDINGLAVIPEPSATILALLGSLWWTCQRRTRRG